MTLDQRIKTDLEELYDSGILTFFQRFNHCKIKRAEQLSMDLFGNPSELSTHGLPGYYAGNRDAKTVMVMLNPGMDVISRDNPFVTEEALERTRVKLGLTISGSFADFIKLFVNGSDNYGDIDLDRIDNFDIKQAAFLKAWIGSGVFIPKDFPGMVKGFPSKPSKDQKKELDELLKKVKRKVLMNKLQLELIPYASREFKSIKDEKMHFLFPFVETLFEEIFRCERKYVIFCSDFFDKLFRMYSDDKVYPGSIVFGCKETMGHFQKERNAYCTPITINYAKGEAMTSINAVIAHTYPNKSLPNAYDKMQEYGKFCFDVFMKMKKASTTIRTSRCKGQSQTVMSLLSNSTPIIHVKRINQEEEVVCPLMSSIVSSDAWRGDKELERLIFVRKIETIRPGVFENCTSLTTIKLCNSLKRIDANAFWGCTALSEVIIPDNLEEVDCWYDLRGVVRGTITNLTSEELVENLKKGYAMDFYYKGDDRPDHWD